MKDYYKILQVDRSADSELIKKIFNYHIKKNHPDLFKDKEKELAMERTQELNEAYSILSNPDKRKVYDSQFEEEENLQKPNASAPTGIRTWRGRLRLKHSNRCTTT